MKEIVFRKGQKFRSSDWTTIEITEVTRYRVYYHITFGQPRVVDIIHFNMPVTYADGMTTKGQLRDLIGAYFDKVSE